MNSDVASLTPPSPARSHRIFHTGIAVAFLITTVAGFGPTYFYKPLHASAPLSPLLHVHGLVFTAWLLLLLTQSAFIAKRRVDLHRRLGMVGAALALAMIPLGIMVAVDAARRGVATPGLEPLVFMVFPFGAVVRFAGFVGAAIWNRRRPEVHRRLILLGTVSILTPAIARLPVSGHNPVLALALSLLFVIAGMIHDWRTRGRVHHIYLWGGVIILLSGPARGALGNTEAWKSFARLLVG